MGSALRRLRAAVTTVGLGVAATAVVVIPTAGTAFAASCPDNNHPNLDGRAGNLFIASNARIRTGPSTNCTSVGQGQLNHWVTYYCWKNGDGGTWTYLYDWTINVSGWVSDSLLSQSGSQSSCV
ncbi:hypothetical protein GCM10007977_049660 [Dactylosporangium sucinum]|uniref:SH3b domain-containing protein n=2 Tax=Dactylosporangium sucinum TaxID=1424081 RepID=A0A917WYN1_9ACTN|nr:hypothetical protein GCM10007977_049660 [Dactylosporangium sucinum]